MAIVPGKKVYQSTNPRTGVAFDNYVDGYCTVPIRSQATPYKSVHGYGTNVNSTKGSNPAYVALYANDSKPPPGSSFDNLTNKAYARWRSRLGDERAQLGSAVLELPKTVEMVSKRLRQLGRAAVALKKGRLGDFLKEFGWSDGTQPRKTRRLNPHRFRPAEVRKLKRAMERNRRKPAELGNLWLEYWMGWAPTVGDIQSTMESLLKTNPNPRRFGASAEVSGDLGAYSGYALGSCFFIEATHRGNVTYRVRHSTQITVVNPNVFLLEKLGLLSPLSTIWEVTPFSWLVGWAVNVEQVLASVSDTYGLHVDSHTTTWVAKAFGTRVVKFGSCDGRPEEQSSYGGTSMRREVGTTYLPRPRLTVRLPDLSPSRAATAASFLVKGLVEWRQTVKTRAS